MVNFPWNSLVSEFQPINDGTRMTSGEFDVCVCVGGSVCVAGFAFRVKCISFAQTKREMLSYISTAIFYILHLGSYLYQIRVGVESY